MEEGDLVVGKYYLLHDEHDGGMGIGKYLGKNILHPPNNSYPFSFEIIAKSGDVASRFCISEIIREVDIDQLTLELLAL